MLTHRPKQLIQTSSLSWLLLAFFVWSQFSYAVHHVDHSIADKSEICAICLQLERDGDAPAGYGHAPAVLTSAGLGAEESPPAPHAARFSPYASRASP